MKMFRWHGILVMVVIAALLVSPVGGSQVLAQDGGRGEKKALSEASPSIATGLIVHFQLKGDGDVDTESQVSAEAAAADISAAAGVNLAYARPMSGGGFVYDFDQAVGLDEARAMAEQVGEMPGVAWAEPNRQFYVDKVPNDASYSVMWNLTAASGGNYGIDAPVAWDITTGNPSLVVAVVDTGILTGHPDLAGRYLPGYDFISNSFVANDGSGRDSDPSDMGDWVSSSDAAAHPECGQTRSSSWHGSHVAGTIGAAADNSVGVAGVNWNSKILPVRVLGKCGGTFADVIDGMRWAAGLTVAGIPANPTPAKVINMSLGGYSGSAGCSASMQAAIDEVNAKGAIIVVAAGNEAMDSSLFEPANCKGVITVGATDLAGYDASYSNYGNTIEINAPGGDGYYSYPGMPYNEILSTVSDSTTSPDQGSFTYGYLQGTSMAAPHIAGIVSLMLSVNPNLTASGVTKFLQDTATPFNPSSACGKSYSCGTGAIANAGRAVKAVEESVLVSFPNRYTTAYVGPHTAPRQLRVITANVGDPALTTVSIGGLPATVVSNSLVGGSRVYVVQPPVQPAIGFYSMTITVNGRTLIFSKAIYYGRTVFLPSIRY